MSLFAGLDAASSRVQAAVFGDDWTLRPKRGAGPAGDVNASGSVDDPDRPSRAIVAIWRETPGDINVPDARDQRADQRPGVASSVAILEVDPRMQSAPALDIRIGDQVVSPSRRIYAIGQAPRDDMGRYLCHLRYLGEDAQ